MTQISAIMSNNVIRLFFYHKCWCFNLFNDQHVFSLAQKLLYRIDENVNTDLTKEDH